VRAAAVVTRPGAGAALAAAAVAALIGVLLTQSPAVAVGMLVALGIGVAVMRFGVVAATVPAFAILPWLVILEGVLPSEVGTYMAALATCCLLYLVLPLRYESALIPLAAACFLAIVLAHAIFATDYPEAVQAAKYMVFPAIVLAVTTERGRELLPALKTPVLLSCAAAMTFHLGVIAAGLGETSTYYNAGEKLGFAAQGPHALALMSMIVAAAGLTLERARYKLLLFGLGALPAALTGVRSALLGLVVVLAIYFIQSPKKSNALGLFLAIGAIAVATGAMDVVLNRFASHPNEFSSLAGAGSGRGEIWTIAIDAWGEAGPWAWLFGTGLRSIVGFELAVLGNALIGHSDIVEVAVQIGILAFAAWVSLWIGLFRAHLRTLILAPILVFGAVNGTLEYVAPLTMGLFLAAACVEPPAAERRLSRA
jgi:hypothetical protein